MMTGIIILNYNNARQTISCVESILKYNSSPAKIVVIDNASTDDSMKTFKRYLSTRQNFFTLLLSKENGGYAQGNNIGLKYFDGDESIDKVMILNNDVIFTEDIIPALSNFLDAHPETGVVSPLLKCRDGKTIDYSCARRDCSIREILFTYLLYFTDVFGILSHFSNKRKILLMHPEYLDKDSIGIELPSGSCFMIKKQLFNNIGWFDPNTFLYYEENILYRKLLAENKYNYILPGVSCIHLGGETTNKVKHSSSYMKSSKASGYYYATRYCELNIVQKAMLYFSRLFFEVMVDVVKAVKKQIAL